MRWREWDGSNEQIATLYASMTPTGKAKLDKYLTLLGETTPKEKQHGVYDERVERVSEVHRRAVAGSSALL
jgi:hypothetical protein